MRGKIKITPFCSLNYLFTLIDKTKSTFFFFTIETKTILVVVCGFSLTIMNPHSFLRLYGPLVWFSVDPREFT